MTVLRASQNVTSAAAAAEHNARKTLRGKPFNKKKELIKMHLPEV